MTENQMNSPFFSNKAPFLLGFLLTSLCCVLSLPLHAQTEPLDPVLAEIHQCNINWDANESTFLRYQLDVPRGMMLVQPACCPSTIEAPKTTKRNKKRSCILVSRIPNPENTLIWRASQPSPSGLDFKRSLIDYKENDAYCYYLQLQADDCPKGSKLLIDEHCEMLLTEGVHESELIPLHWNEQGACQLKEQSHHYSLIQEQNPDEELPKARLIYHNKKDASLYNIRFYHREDIIDFWRIGQAYQEGEHWVQELQFCQHYPTSLQILRLKNPQKVKLHLSDELEIPQQDYQIAMNLPLQNMQTSFLSQRWENGRDKGSIIIYKLSSNSTAKIYPTSSKHFSSDRKIELKSNETQKAIIAELSQDGSHGLRLKIDPCPIEGKVSATIPYYSSQSEQCCDAQSIPQSGTHEWSFDGITYKVEIATDEEGEKGIRVTASELSPHYIDVIFETAQGDEMSWNSSSGYMDVIKNFYLFRGDLPDKIRVKHHAHPQLVMQPFEAHLQKIKLIRKGKMAEAQRP